MKAYEFPIKVTPEGKLDVPAHFLELLPQDRVVRAIILVDEMADGAEQADWSRLTTEQFLAGYSDADAIYDRVR